MNRPVNIKEFKALEERVAELEGALFSLNNQIMALRKSTKRTPKKTRKKAS